MTKTINLFCGICNSTVAFEALIDQNCDYLFTCQTCQHSLKFSKDVVLADAVRQHQEMNAPCVQVHPETGEIIMTSHQESQIDEAIDELG